MKKNVEILMLDKRFLDKKMAELPGLTGVKELPGVPIKENDDCDEDDMEDDGYCSKCGTKLKHNEPDVDDAGGPSDDDEDNMKSAGVAKKERSFFKMLVKKLFDGPSKPKPVMFSPLYSEKNGVSIINIDGELGKRTNEPGIVDVDEITKAIKISASANTSAVVLHINSPGGGTTGIEEAGEMIKKLTTSKPVFTYCDTICASAAYWLASCTSGIFATPSSELGSIGVYAKVVDYSENLKMNGINVQVFSAGEMKMMGQGDNPLTEKEAKYIQDDINDHWIKFKTVVVNNRGNVDEAHMQGQLLAGVKALEANLVDEIVPDFETVLSQITQ